ncbi:MAG TPA: MarR family winged helix-turn-helix transcriptional regulator [Caldimonas sp.]|jgi:DNA-binding MarR family transcriptional regulator|nr:MarR family winged helix-turn-helix transcriptional regulator [Caldimonas sp.]HEX2540298.1 MarR family winged helix-turn-helix transcriptional regulator [Caldimonas sp.]
MPASRSPRPPSRAGGAGPRGCTNLKLRQLTRRVSQHYDRIVGTCGLKTTQYSLLSFVERLGPSRPGELAEAMQMDASTLTRNLQPLVAQGWVEVGPGSDGRSRVVAITPAGRDKRAEAQREWKRAQLALNRRLGEARLAQLHDLLDECLAEINRAPEEDAHA